VISSLLKQVMRTLGLTQADLAEVLEVSIDRVKSLTSGRVKKLTREESQLLVDKLEIRAEWLITGEGPMLQDDEAQDEFANRMRNISLTHAMIDAMSISQLEKSRAKILVTGDPASDAKIIAEAMASGTAVYTGDGSPTVLTARESALLDNYRAAPEDGKQALEATGAALAKPAEILKKAS